MNELIRCQNVFYEYAMLTPTEEKMEKLKI